jgi:hypothetical protein
MICAFVKLVPNSKVELKILDQDVDFNFERRKKYPLWSSYWGNYFIIKVHYEP